MWRRQTRDESKVPISAPAPDEAEKGFTPWEVWEGNWARDERERVARWLSEKVGHETKSVLEQQGDRLATAFRGHRIEATDRRGTPSDPAPSRSGPLGRPDRRPLPAMESALDLLKAEVATLEERRRSLAAAIETERTRLDALEEQRRDVAAAAEAERAELHGLAERRRSLLAAFQADQLEVERVRQLQGETRAGLEAEISFLENRRNQLAAESEGAAAWAEAIREGTGDSA